MGCVGSSKKGDGGQSAEQSPSAAAPSSSQPPVPPSAPPADDLPPRPIAEAPSAVSCGCQYEGTWTSQQHPSFRVEERGGELWYHPEGGPSGRFVLQRPDAASRLQDFPADLHCQADGKSVWMLMDRVLHCRVMDRGQGTVVPATYRLDGAPDLLLPVAPQPDRATAPALVQPAQPPGAAAPLLPVATGPLPPAVRHNGVQWLVGVSLVGGARMGREHTVTGCHGEGGRAGPAKPALRVDRSAPYWQVMKENVRFLGCERFTVHDQKGGIASLDYVPSPSDLFLLVLKDKQITVEFEGTVWSFGVKPKTLPGSIERDVLKNSGLLERLGPDAGWGIRGPMPSTEWVSRPLTFSRVRDGQRYKLDLKEKTLIVHGDDRLTGWPTGRSPLASQVHSVLIGPQDTTHDIRRRIAEQFGLDRLGVGPASWYIEYGCSPWTMSTQIRVPEAELKYKILPNPARNPDPPHLTIRFQPKRIELLLGSGQQRPGGTKVASMEIRPEGTVERHRNQVLRALHMERGGIAVKVADSAAAQNVMLSWGAVKDGTFYYVFLQPKTIKVTWDEWERRADELWEGDISQVIELESEDTAMDAIAQRFNISKDLFDLMEIGTERRQWRVGEKVMVQYDQEGDEFDGWFAATVTHSAGPHVYNVRFEDGSIANGVHTLSIARYVSEAHFRAPGSTEGEFMIVLKPKTVTTQFGDARVGSVVRHTFDPASPGPPGGVPPGTSMEAFLCKIGERLGLMEQGDDGGACYETVPEASITGERFCFYLRFSDHDAKMKYRSTAWSSFHDHGSYDVVLKEKTISLEFCDGSKPAHTWDEFVVEPTASASRNRRAVRERFETPVAAFEVWRKGESDQKPVQLDWWGVIDRGVYCVQPAALQIDVFGDSRLPFSDPFASARTAVSVLPGESGADVWRRIVADDVFSLQRLWHRLRLGTPDFTLPAPADTAAGVDGFSRLRVVRSGTDLTVHAASIGYGDGSRQQQLELRLPRKVIRVFDVASRGCPGARPPEDFDVLPGETHEDVLAKVTGEYAQEIRASKGSHVLRQRQGAKPSTSDPESRSGGSTSMAYATIDCSRPGGVWFDLYRAKNVTFARHSGAEMTLRVKWNSSTEDLRRDLNDRFRIPQGSFLLSLDGVTQEELSYDTLLDNGFYFIDRAM